MESDAFIVTTLVAVLAIARGCFCAEPCNGAILNLTTLRGNIKSPNYRNESGKADNCTWNIRLRPGYSLRLYVLDLQLHYLDGKKALQCMPSYKLIVNHERLGCNPLTFVREQEKVRGSFCMEFHSHRHRCNPKQDCNVTRAVDKAVQIRYESDGKTILPRGKTSRLAGFHIWYSINDEKCPSYPTLPAQVKSATTNQPATTALNTSSSDQNWIFLAIAILAAVALFAVIFILCKRRQRQMRHGKDCAPPQENQAQPFEVTENHEVLSTYLPSNEQQQAASCTDVGPSHVYASVDRSENNTKSTVHFTKEARTCH